MRDATGTDRRGALVGLTVAVLAISTAGVLTRWAFDGGADPLAIAFWRTFGGALVLLPAGRHGLAGGDQVRQRRLTTAAGAFLGLHFALWLSSLQYTTVASSVTLVTMSPLFVAVGARRWLRESVTGRTWVGMAIALAGAVAIGLADGFDVDLGASALGGDVLALGGAIAVAGYLLLGRVSRQVAPLAWYAARTYGWAAGVLLVACVFTSTPVWGFEAQGWWAIAGMIAGPQLLGHTVFNNLLDRVPPTTVSTAILAEPVGATLLAWVFLAELPAPLFWLAAPIVLVGIGIATVARSGQPPRRNPVAHAHAPGDDPTDAAEWDDRYRSEDRVWSGRPNGTLVAEIDGLPPGTALDLACGEGADAIWLAQQGWQVTAIDVSQVALERGADAAEQAGVEITWRQADATAADTDLGVHDLVSCQYAALRKNRGGTIERVLGAVAVGGTLLYVHHADVNHDGHDHGFDPDEYVQPSDVAAALGDGWEIEAHETRPRPGPLPDDARHTHDVVLRVRRT